MLRIIVRTDDAAMASNVGGSVETTHKTFDICAPALEAYLKEKIDFGSTKYSHRQIVGVEQLD
jgi:hypothetical protein